MKETQWVVCRCLLHLVQVCVFVRVVVSVIISLHMLLRSISLLESSVMEDITSVTMLECF